MSGSQPVWALAQPYKAKREGCTVFFAGSLHHAVEVGSIDKIKALEDASKAVHGHHHEATGMWRKRDSVLGAMAIHVAAEKGKSNVVQYLIKNLTPDDLSAGDNNMVTPLHLATIRGHYSIVQMLINAGASPSCKDYQGDQPLHWAASKGHTQIMQLLLQRGASVKDRNNAGWTALHMAACYGRNAACRLLLLSHSADLHAITEDGWTPLHFAAYHSKLEVMNELITKFGANTDCGDFKGCTPLGCCETRQACYVLYAAQLQQMKERARCRTRRKLSVNVLLDEVYNASLAQLLVLCGTESNGLNGSDKLRITATRKWMFKPDCGCISFNNLIAPRKQKQLSDGPIVALREQLEASQSQVQQLKQQIHDLSDATAHSSEHAANKIAKLTRQLKHKDRSMKATLAALQKQQDAELLAKDHEHALVCSTAAAAKEEASQQLIAELQPQAKQHSAEQQARAEQHSMRLQAQAAQHSAKLRAQVEQHRAEQQARAEQHSMRLQAQAAQQSAELQAQVEQHRAELRALADQHSMELQVQAEQHSVEQQVHAEQHSMEQQAQTEKHKADMLSQAAAADKRLAELCHFAAHVLGGWKQIF